MPFHLQVNGRARSVEAAWIAFDVPQCGYCQSGIFGDLIKAWAGSGAVCPRP
jgi:aerobic-type carbon monoxide dehydrogenase small subunit (CoxS/CutS family)